MNACKCLYILKNEEDKVCCQ